MDAETREFVQGLYDKFHGEIRGIHARLDDLVDRIEATHGIAKKIQADQLTAERILDAAALMSEIKEREGRARRDTDPAPSEVNGEHPPPRRG